MPQASIVWNDVTVRNPCWTSDNTQYLHFRMKGKVPETGTLYAYAVDTAGNVSEVIRPARRLRLSVFRA